MNHTFKTIDQFAQFMILVGGSTYVSIAGPLGDQARRQRGPSSLVGSLELRDGDRVMVYATVDTGTDPVYVSVEAVYSDNLCRALAECGVQPNHWGAHHDALSGVTRPPRQMSGLEALTKVEA